MKCPHCQHELTPVSNFWICPEHGQVVPEEQPSPSSGDVDTVTVPKLFLSYARSDDEPFVKRLYEDLKARGFEV